MSASATRGFTCHGSGEAVDCTGGSLPEGGEAAITIVAAAPETTGVAVNEATVDPDGAVTELEEESNNTFRLAVEVVATMPDLRVTTQDAPNPAPTGAPLTRTITVENIGDGDAAGVLVWDRFPSSVEFVTATGDGGFTCKRSLQRGTWGAMLGFECGGATIPAGESRTITASLTAPVYPMTYSNRVSVDPYRRLAELDDSNTTRTDPSSSNDESGRPRHSQPGRASASMERPCPR